MASKDKGIGGTHNNFLSAPGDWRALGRTGDAGIRPHGLILAGGRGQVPPSGPGGGGGGFVQREGALGRAAEETEDKRQWLGAFFFFSIGTSERFC